MLPKERRLHHHYLLLLLLLPIAALLLLLLPLSPTKLLLHLPTAATATATPPKLLLLLPSPGSPPPPPSLAYLLSGSRSDSPRLLRLLHSLYHPRNRYLLHLDRSAPAAERRRLALDVRGSRLFRSARNVDVVGEPDFADPRGSSALAATLHAAAVLLRSGPGWDWLVNLSAGDYPLVTQDDLLHIMSYLPKDVNFVLHSGYIGWRESRRMKPIIVDPGLYLSAKGDIFYATQKREYPTAFKIFTGSPSLILSREFTEFCILGTDNLPRTLLMYYANMPSSHMNYFHTVLCNSPNFNGTTINHNLHFVSWDDPPRREPRALGTGDFENMVSSGAAFGSWFVANDSVLDKIDHDLLNRAPGKVVPGGWCLGTGNNADDPCDVWGKADILRPGPGAQRLEKSLVGLLSNGTLSSQHCIF